VGLGPLTYANQHGLHIHPTLMVTARAGAAGCL
jgi:hypothetical protein